MEMFRKFHYSFVVEVKFHLFFNSKRIIFSINENRKTGGYHMI